MMNGCRPLRGLFLYIPAILGSPAEQLGWGARLYAVAALRGLNANSSPTCSDEILRIRGWVAACPRWQNQLCGLMGSLFWARAAAFSLLR
jgi:hypothetical protein